MGISTIEAAYDRLRSKLRADWADPESTVKAWHRNSHKWTGSRTVGEYPADGGVSWLVFMLSYKNTGWQGRSKRYEHVSGVLNGSIIEIRYYKRQIVAGGGPDDARSIRLRGTWTTVALSVDYSEWVDTGRDIGAFGRSVAEHGATWLWESMSEHWADLSEGDRRDILNEWSLGN